MKHFIIFRCDHDNSTVVSVSHETRDDVYMGVAEVPDMHTARVVLESLRKREFNKLLEQDKRQEES